MAQRKHLDTPRRTLRDISKSAEHIICHDQFRLYLPFSVLFTKGPLLSSTVGTVPVQFPASFPDVHNTTNVTGRTITNTDNGGADVRDRLDHAPMMNESGGEFETWLQFKCFPDLAVSIGKAPFPFRGIGHMQPSD